MIYKMHDNYHREDERLKTFDTWSLSFMDKHQLAQTGMFFTRDEDKVKCYFCEVEIGRWEQGDEVVAEHLRWSPNCTLLCRRTTSNVPISTEALNRILPPAFFNTCGNNDTNQDYSEAAMSATAQASDISCIGPSNPAASHYSAFPEYEVEAARIRSFADWPRSMKQKPEQMAEAGFFYTNVADRVKCFSCGMGLMDWMDTDDPWEQHALWLSKCRFLKLIKGQVYIENVVNKNKDREIGKHQAFNISFTK